jgi:hypothetical protein
MQSNVGGSERTVRLVLGFAFALTAILSSAPWLMWSSVVLAVAMLGSGTSGYCPINGLFGRTSAGQPREARRHLI